MSDRTAVYRLRDAEHILLYVGTSHNPDQRMAWHRTTQPWGGRIHHRDADEWYDTRELAEAAETAAEEAERPLYNIAKSPYRPITYADGTVAAVTKDEHLRYTVAEKFRQPKETRASTPVDWMTPPQVAKLTDPPTTRYTVEREIKRGNLDAEPVGARWIIDRTEAERWASQFRPYAALRVRPAPTA